MPHNPVDIQLRDLTELKKKAENFFLPQSDHKVVTGFGGVYSPFKSRGLDFQEVRAYQPGDDIRQIDWHVTAKYGKPFTKLYTEEKERTIFFVVDLRNNMHFATHGDFKSVVAARLTAFMAAIAEHQKDKIGYLLLTDEGVFSSGKSDMEMLPHLFNDMVSVPARKTQDGSWDRALRLLIQLLPVGSFVFFFSDFYDWQREHTELLARISDKNTFLFVSIYDQLETRIPEDTLPFSDGVHTVVVPADDNKVRQRFHKEWQQHQDELKQAAGKYMWGYLPLATDEDYLASLIHFCFGENAHAA